MYRQEYDPSLEARENHGPACHKCGKQSPEVDLVQCTNIHCDRSICCDCASEVEFEMEACSDHAFSVFVDLRTMYRAALDRASAASVTRERRVA
jgi:hypothetical protein